MYHLTGKVAVVTGGASGMGRKLVDRLTAAGANVVVADVDESGGARAASEAPAPGKAVFQRTDVGVEEDVAAMVARAKSEFGGLDMAFNNAGFDGQVGPLVEQTIEDVRKVIDVNLMGVFFGLKYEITAMLERGGGTIVNTASIAGLRGHPGISPYSAAKHGVNGFTKSAAIEYGSQGIRVNSICPGGIRTPMLEQYLQQAPELKALIIDNNPMRRMGEADEMAATALWLASPEASYVNGQTLAVDGGKICSDI